MTNSAWQVIPFAGIVVPPGPENKVLTVVAVWLRNPASDETEPGPLALAVTENGGFVLVDERHRLVPLAPEATQADRMRAAGR